MNIEDIIKKTLDEQLAGYSKFHTFILLGFVIMQALFIFWQNRNMEKFKALLKKSEIKYSRYHELQVNALKNGYQKLVLFKKANANLLYSRYDTNDHTYYKSRINEWIGSYSACINQFSMDKLVLPRELKDSIQNTLTDFHEMIEILIRERKHLDYTEEEGYGNWNLMYDYSDNELAIINEKINRLKTENSTQKSTQNIQVLRTQIEDYFEKMNS